MSFRSAVRAAVGAVIAVTLTAVAPSESSAQAITLTHQGSGSGSLNGLGFSNRFFTITAIGNVEDRVTASATVFRIGHNVASINIEGIGLFTFAGPTRTFVNNNTGTIGFSQSAGDLFNGPENDLFKTWDMTTSIGAVSGPGTLLQWGAGVSTSGGTLTFNTASTTSTFSAVVAPTAVPEPSSFALVAVAGVLLVGRQASRRRHKVG